MKKRIRRNARIVRLVMYKETLLDFREHLMTFIGSFMGIGLIALFHSKLIQGPDGLFLIGSFGASAVLIYGVINSPLAQPRNLIGGHVVSAIIGVTINKLFPSELWLSAGLAVSLSIVAMQATKTLHPPGGATALIAVIGSEKIKALGFLYVFTPVLSGVMVLLLVAIICNNGTPHRSYPANKKWYRVWERKYFRPKLK